MRTLIPPAIQPPVFTLRDLIDMADAANDIEDLVWKFAVELPMRLRPVKAVRT